MDLLGNAIRLLSKEEIRFYKVFASRLTLHEGRKDLKLFNLLKKAGEDYSDEEICRKIYGKDDRNAFYRLKNRLLGEINKSVIIQHFDDNEINYCFNLLTLSRFYSGRHHFKLALHYLKKSEAVATRVENYELLDMIYGEFIRLSQETLNINPETYISKRNEIRGMLNHLHKIDDILATASFRLKVTQNFSLDSRSTSLLKKTIREFENNAIIRKSPRLKTRIFTAVSQVLLQTHDFLTLESYSKKTLREFEKNRIFGKENHEVRLKILSYITNACFKNKKYSESLEFAERLHDAMKEFNKMLYEKYLPFYYNSLVINYSVLDREKGIRVLEDITRNRRLKKNPYYEIFAYLNLAIFWFDKDSFHNSIRNLNKVYLHDQFQNTDEVLKFKIHVSELMIRFELNDFDLLENKIKAIHHDFHDLLNKKEFKREKDFMDLISRISSVPDLKADRKLLSSLKTFISGDQEKKKETGTEVIRYNDWLKRKFAGVL